MDPSGVIVQVYTTKAHPAVVYHIKGGKGDILHDVIVSLHQQAQIDIHPKSIVRPEGGSKRAKTTSFGKLSTNCK